MMEILEIDSKTSGVKESQISKFLFSFLLW